MAVNDFVELSHITASQNIVEFMKADAMWGIWGCTVGGENKKRKLNETG